MARVLVIEDEPGITLVLKLALTDEGYEVIASSDGLSGLKQLEQEPAPDIVLVDLCLPVLSGRALINKMHSNPRWRNIPVVIITGSIPNSKDFPPSNTYRALIYKPFDLFKLLKTVKELTEEDHNSLNCRKVFYQQA